MAWARELLASVAHLSPVGPQWSAFTDEETTGSLAFYPVVGLGLGLLTAGASAVVLRWTGQPLAGAAAVGILDAWSSGRHRRSLAAVSPLLVPQGFPRRATVLLGVGLTLGTLLLKLACEARMPPPTPAGGTRSRSTGPRSSARPN